MPTEYLQSCWSLFSHDIVNKECLFIAITSSSLPFISPLSKWGLGPAVHSSQQGVAVEMWEAQFLPLKSSDSSYKQTAAMLWDKVEKIE